MLTLSLLRHAKSSWKNPTLPDRERPLSARGIADASMMGRAMTEHGIDPELVLCSSARRTLDTLSLVLPELKGRLDGYAIRVPTADVSAVDLSVELCTDTTAAAINKALEDAADSSLKGILQLSREPLVSTDFRGNSHSAVVDAQLTKLIDGNFAKLLIWYDNEWGYANRLVDWAESIGT